MALKALPLALSGGLDTGADGGGRFSGLGRAELVEAEGRGFDLDIDPIQEGARDFGPIFTHLQGGATALPLAITEVAARTWVHRRDEHEAGGQGDFGGCPRDRDMAVFEGLAENFQGGAPKLRKFI